MSNHEPDFNRSVRRHRGPIWGLVAIGIFITLLTTAYVLWWGVEESALDGDLQGGEPPQVQDFGGEVMGTRPVEGQDISRDPTPGPVGVLPDAPGVDVERRDLVE
jgi:hypothetical protein